MIKIIVFCAPNFNYLISTDVISQYFFFKNTKEEFKKYNYEIYYFYDFLDEKDMIKYKSLSENYKYNDDDLITIYKKEREFVLEKIVESPYFFNDILIGYESIGYDAFFYEKFYNKLLNKKMKLIISKDDPQCFTDKKNNNFFKIIDNKCEKASYIISRSVIFFKNIDWEFYKEKCKFIPMSFDTTKIDYLKLSNFNNFMNRKKKILLNGSLQAYKYRKILYKGLILNDKSFYNSIKNPDNIIEFKKILEFKLKSLNNRKNLSANEEQGGLQYCQFISEYMGYFVFFGTFPIDFPLFKILECMLSGCIAFIEPKNYLLEDFGLIEYIHYVPVLIEDNKIDLNPEYYNKYLGTELGKQIAENGFNYAIQNFSDKKVVEKYLKILSEI